MATQERVPFAPQDTNQVASLIHSLESATQKAKGKGGFSCKKTAFAIAGTDLSVNAWRFQDWDYKRDDLPTHARGLFTYKTRNGTPKIAARGYDKFFNVNEVHSTKWENLIDYTQGPYELSVKENGCIIFISGIEHDVLLVCSKHSTGARQDTDLSHAQAGERWVEKHLAAVGKTKDDLARELRRRNVTAVAELCDDDFEEHVLAYDEKSAGLYLHGMNLNLPGFATYPGPLVHEFADEWGFKKAEFLFKDDIETVKRFLDGCAETGSWNGKSTEGFVVRCQRREGGRDSPFIDWFFKYKFEEPYLLYRQWRECTKAIISGRVPRYKKHVKYTEEYLLYARRQLAKTPGLGKAYQANHGIIKMRDGFLAEKGLKGSDIIREEYSGNANVGSDVANNIILVPIATIGCGKTTVALALTKLFGWGHVQNDNIIGQKGRPKQFASLLATNLAQYPVVIADRNNHQKRERKQLFDDLSRSVLDVRYVALHYVHDPKSEKLPEIRRVTQERVFGRGDNHQTIQAGTKSRAEIIGIMEGFLERFEPLEQFAEPDNSFDEVINLDVTEDSRHNLELVVNALREAYPKLIPEPPSPADLDNAIAAALDNYTPDIKHDLSFKSKNNRNQGGKGRDSDANWRDRSPHSVNAPQPKYDKIEYFCVRVPSATIISALESTFSSQDPNTARFYRQLQHGRRVQPTFHVTLVHRSSINQHKDLWQHLTALHLQSKTAQPSVPDPAFGKCAIQLERVVWDNRVMSVVVRVLDENWTSVNNVPHITIGTAESSIKPVESNALLGRWEQMGTGQESGISEILVKGRGVIQGEVKGVLPTTR